MRRNQQYQKKYEEPVYDTYKPNDKFKINISFLARYKWFAVIFSKQMRRIYPDTWENVLVLSVLLICIGLFIWRLYGFKVFYLRMKPFGIKPLITKQIVLEKNLSMDDLNFIYENNDEYDLDSYVLKEVEAYRIRNNLSLNKSIKQNK